MHSRQADRDMSIDDRPQAIGITFFAFRYSIFKNIMVECNRTQQNEYSKCSCTASYVAEHVQESYMNHFKRTIFALVIATLFIATPLFSQAIEEQRPQSTTSAVDANGRIVTLPGVPKKVIVAGKAAIMPADAFFLFPEAREIMQALSKTDQGLGDFYNLIMPELKDSKRIPQNASAEEIASYNPDLVLMKTSNFEGTAKKLDQLGIRSFTMDLESAEAWNDELLQLGKLLGNEARAAEITALYDSRKEAVEKQTATLQEADKPTVLVLQFSVADGIAAFEVCPDSWIQTYLVEAAGGIPVWKGAGLATKTWTKVSFEQIAVWNPDYIYIVSYKTPADKFLTQIYSTPNWAGLKAVQMHRVRTTPADYVSYAQPDSRWILHLQWLAHDLHPQLFPEFDMEQEITSFYQDFYKVENMEVIGTLLDAYRASIAKN